MQIEYEAKFLDMEPERFRERLEQQGAILIKPETLMRRWAFVPTEKHDIHCWARVRDEGDKITMTIKRRTDYSLSGVKEAEVVIHDFEAGCAVLEAAGFVKATYQETLREAWQLGEVEITIDTWPGLAPYAEIEGPGEEAVKAVAERLEVDIEQAVYGGVTEVYEKAGLAKEVFLALTRVTFEEPPRW
jgi:adenylate cyclase, class 2